MTRHKNKNTSTLFIHCLLNQRVEHPLVCLYMLKMKSNSCVWLNDTWWGTAISHFCMVCLNSPCELTSSVKIDQSDGILDSGILVRPFVRGIEWSIRDFARLRDPCLTLRDRDPNVNIESEPETLPVINPSPRLKNPLSRSKRWKYFEFMVRNTTKNSNGSHNGSQLTYGCNFRDCETQITKIWDFATAQCVASPRFRDSCLESRDFETGRILSETHDFR